MTDMNTAEATLETLARAGIDTIYALPGVHNDALFDALFARQDSMRVLHPRHEQAAGYMALGAALATGKPQVFAVVPGPGLLNASAALLTAYGLGAPVVALVGQIPADAIDRGYGHLHELPDQLGLLRHITKHAARIPGPAEAPAMVSDALRLATSGRHRPVALECAIDVWPQSGPVAFPPPGVPAEPLLDTAALDQAAALLAAARRPVIFAGGGALDAGPEVLALAERLGAPVVTFRRARGVIPTDHPLAASFPVGHRLWREADAVIAIGTRLTWPLFWWGSDKDLKIIKIEVDPEEVFRLRRPDCAILGDAAPVLRGLLARLPATPRPPPASLALHQAWFAERLTRLEPQMGFLRAIRAALPEDGIVVEDVTQVAFAGRLAFPVARPRLYLSAGYQDNLGWCYGTALGAKAAQPDRAVVAICGDGGFMYQVGELATAMRHHLAVVVIVFDDGAFGNVRRIQAERYGNRLIACDLHNPDFVRLAESFGMAAFRATTAAELEGALARALALGVPALIHVPVGEMPSPWDMMLMPRIRGDETWRRNLP